MMADNIGLAYVELPSSRRRGPVEAAVGTLANLAPARKRKRARSLSSDDSGGGGSSIEGSAVLHMLPSAALAAAPVADAAAPCDSAVLSEVLKRTPGRYYSISREASSRCYRCKEVGHYAMFCTAAPKQNACWICGNVDHDCRDCDVDACFVCDEVGHRWGQCPNRQGIEREVLRAGSVLGYGRHLVMMLGPEDAASRLMPRRAIVDGRAQAFSLMRQSMPAAQVLLQHFCLLCASSGHKTDSCPASARALALTQCTCCLKRGHAYCAGNGAVVAPTVPELPAIASVRPKDAGSCFNCGSGAHEGAACPKPRSCLFDGSIGPQAADEVDTSERNNKRSRYKLFDEEEEEEEEADPWVSRQDWAQQAPYFGGSCFKCGRAGHRAVDCVPVETKKRPLLADPAPAVKAPLLKAPPLLPAPAAFHPGVAQASAPSAAAPAKAKKKAKAKAKPAKGQQEPPPPPAPSPPSVEEREPWWKRDKSGLLAAERHRIMSVQGVSDVTKKHQLTKLRKLSKRHEKSAGL
jgi:hypothetical protein